MQAKLFISLALALLPQMVLAASAGGKNEAPAGLTAEFVYKYLVGEIAAQRGDVGLAGAALFELAQSSRDSRLAERATRAAIYGNQPAIAMRAAALWTELDPESSEARQAYIQMMLAAGKAAELRPHLQKLIAAEEDKAGLFMYLVGMLARTQDKAGVLKMVQALAKPYPDLAEAHFAVAHAAWSAKQEKIALQSLDRAEALLPGMEPAALLKGQLLAGRSAEEALKFYEHFLQENPGAGEVRLASAKLLVGERRFEEAKAAFVRLIDLAPQNPEIQVVVGLLNVQIEDFSAAEINFLKALELGFKDEDQLKIYLGQVAEHRQRPEEAKRWYEKVDPRGQLLLDAQIRYGRLLVAEGKLDEARRRLQGLEISNEQRVIANQTEAGWLMQAKREREAFELLRQTVEVLPNSPDSVYDYAMVAEKVGEFEVMEHELRKLILLKPDMGHAYNALGYSLADRNERLDEAQKLIEKALSLNPEDHFILDSMGWVKYRLGQFGKALDYLQRAYAAQPDPEIAAHLGEVLWQQGRHDEAVRTWEDALRDHPDNEVLKSTAKKFRE